MKTLRLRFLTRVNSFGKKLISSSDYFAQQPQLRIQKQKKFSTTLGAFMTYCIITVCIIQLISQIQDIFDKNHPNVITSEFQLFNTDEYILYPHNYTVALALTNGKLQTIQGQNLYFNISIMNCKRQRYINETNGQKIPKLDCYYYPVEECTDKHFPSEFQQKYFKSFNKSGLYCAKISNWNERPIKLQGTPQSDVFQYIDIFISKCKNNTEYQNCSSDQDINSLLSGNYLAIHSSDSLTKMQEYKNSFEKIISAQYYFYSVSITKTMLSQLKLIEVLSDIGLLTTNIQKEFSFQQLTVKEASEVYNNQYIFKYGIIIDQRMAQYSRTYQKLQNAFSNIGGLFQVLSLISQIFLNPFTTFLTEIEMANEYFRFESNSKGKKNNHKHQKQKSFFIPQDQCQEIVEDELPNTSGRVQKEKQKQIIQSNRLENSIDIQKFLNYQQLHQKMSKQVIFQLAICCNRQKNKQIHYAIDKVMSKLDVSFIIQKLQELDKLKYLLLSNDQINLFNYIPKPLIPFGVFEQEFQENIQNLEQKISYKLILDDEKSEITKINDAFKSYQNLKLKQYLSQTDKQILEFLDDEIKCTFDQLFVQNFRGLESREKRPVLDMESICESRFPVRDSMVES
ncbi:unnamed protein product [Paramecium pentaurelia]|uniref:Transmembrane protein n=1 Tax=Paramecium pentaurelia TaxID=43138 RepID=A0A8S1SBY1_9CILI|nr:unnamed protein product [Paramecium pentaurelia]